jgi:hypothetical protein
MSFILISLIGLSILLGNMWGVSEAQLVPLTVNATSSLNRGLTNWWLVHPSHGGGGVTLSNLVSNRHGTLTGMALSGSTTSGWQKATSRRGGFGEIRCNGTSDYIATPTTTTFNITAGSAAIWVNPTTTATGIRPWTDLNTGAIYLDFSAADTLAFNIFNVASISVVVPFSVTANSWQHVLVTWSSVGAFAYKNGLLIASDTTNSGVLGAAATAPIEICGDHNFATTFYNGAMDDVRMWNRALSASEAKAVYLDSIGGYRDTLLQAPPVGFVITTPPAAAPRHRSRTY